MNHKLTLGLWLAAALGVSPSAQADVHHARRLNSQAVELTTTGGQTLLVDFYGEGIFRLFRDDTGGIVRNPEATPPAVILAPGARRGSGEIKIDDNGATVQLTTAKATLEFDKQTGALTVTDRKTGRVAVQALSEPAFEAGKSTTLTLGCGQGENFYGGGVQNGRFSHRGEAIQIVNTNNWTDGGVASPTPFYWSTAGYGIMWHTFAPGRYDFGKAAADRVTLMHETGYLDIFVMIDAEPVALLRDFYQLTGNPVLLPKFGFYEGHLNAYNRDYWKEVPDGADGAMGMAGAGGSVLFEDGKYYKESQTDNGGIKESLNGELTGNSQFSARAVIDRYEKADMPLGWVLPNDGYGAGYGQTETLDGNIQNLKDFGDYARSKGVEIGLWTQSDLHPKEGIEALLQRDIVKEVRDAGVRVLKTDVAWVGAGYSFGLNGVADVGEVMPYYGGDARPFIISLDGWAGTQRYAGIWTGDQTGGEWEYIRFHIPTYICSGLSGQPNICSDMDGIFGGRNLWVNVRDFQWKTFTPMQLNMDGWGSNPKYPQALGREAADINRRYLKLKAALMPYTYSIAHEAVTGKPMVRAMFLEETAPLNPPSKGSDTSPSLEGKVGVGLWGLPLDALTRYQFMYGPYILVAPIYQDTRMDENGDDERDGIYLPEGEWIEAWPPYSVLQGGRIINNRPAPLARLPYFYKRGAIIPMTSEHNNPTQVDPALRIYRVFPAEAKTTFLEYDDDGRTLGYLDNECTTTLISQQQDAKRKRATITIDPMKGTYQGVTTTRTTVIEVLASATPRKVTAKAGGKAVVPTVEMPTEGSPFIRITLPAKDVRQKTEVVIDGYTLDTSDPDTRHTGPLTAPRSTGVVTGPRTLTPQWTSPDSADYCEVEFEGRIYSTIKRGELLFEGLSPETTYTFRLRAVNAGRGHEAEGRERSSNAGRGHEAEGRERSSNAGRGHEAEGRERSGNAGGHSPWSAPITATTDADPLEHAIRGLRGEATVASQPGQDVRHLFDLDESKGWHTTWGEPDATPFDLIIDLRTVNTLDRIEYIPRPDAGNGTITRGTVAWSTDRQTWHDEQPFTWARDGKVKTFPFTSPTAPLNPPSRGSDTSPSLEGRAGVGLCGPARYVKLHVEEAVGGFGSGQELYIFRQPGSQYYIPGDVNHDGRIDDNDLTSYMNYTGLRSGDPDYEGYMSQGDLDRNGLIDAYDISAVAIELEGGVSGRQAAPVAGTVTVRADKPAYKAGDVVTVTVSGTGLRSVNAISLALPYSADEMEYLGTEGTGTLEMRNLTCDRLHSNGRKALYPTYVNCGEHPCVEGDVTILTVRFRAKRAVRAPVATDGMIIDKYLNRITF